MAGRPGLFTGGDIFLGLTDGRFDESVTERVGSGPYPEEDPGRPA